VVSIITVTYNSFHCLRRLRKSLKDHTPELHQWLLVDNGSDRHETKTELLDISAAGEGEVVWLKENRRFTKATNVGLERAWGDPVVLLNPDCEVTSGWLTALQRPLQKPKVGIVGTVLVDETGMVVHGGARNMGEHDGYGERYRPEAAWALEREHDGWITGACLLITKEALGKVGGRLNERYPHYHSDRFLCEDVRKAGYRIWVSSHVMVHSVGRSGW
jgi:GT2 family glycosyltransferase